MEYSRYAELEELEKDYAEVTYDSHVINEAAGLTIQTRYNAEGEVVGGLLDSGDTNTIIASTTGAGKTTYLLQYILSCIYAGHPFIVHDPKNELYGIFYTLLKKMGYRTRTINLREPMKGDRFNFLERAARLYKEGKRGEAMVIAREIASQLYADVEDKNDKFWTESSINLFLCYFCIAADIYDEPEDVTLQAIYQIHIEGMEKKGSRLRIQIYLEAHKNEKCYELGIPFAEAPNDTRSSVHSVFSSGLVRLILNDDVSDLLSHSTFSVEELVSDRPTALFIITSDESPKAYAAVVAAIVDTIYGSLVKYAQKDGRTVSRLPKPTHFIIDEAGHIKFNNINEMMTTSRSRGIRMVLVLQSLKQLNVMYGKDMTDIIIGNAQNFVFLSSTDIELLKMVSERSGHRLNEVTGKIEPLININDLPRFRVGEALLLLDRHMPYRTTFPDLPYYSMLEPLERVEFEDREPLRVKKGMFSDACIKIVEEIHYKAMEREKKIQQILRDDKKSADIPNIFKEELKDIINS